MEIFTRNIIEFWYIMLVVFILGRFIYYPNQGRREYLFTYIMLAALISILCILISHINFSIGFALGIFAVFSIVRYRTVQISPREITYIFLAAGIAAKNGLVPDDVEYSRIVITDVFILIVAWLAEYFHFGKRIRTKLLMYDNLELIHPHKYEELIKDLNQRFGISNVKRVQIGKIDALKSSARLRIEFRDLEDKNFNDE